MKGKGKLNHGSIWHENIHLILPNLYQFAIQPLFYPFIPSSAFFEPTVTIGQCLFGWSCGAAWTSIGVSGESPKAFLLLTLSGRRKVQGVGRWQRFDCILKSYFYLLYTNPWAAFGGAFRILVLPIVNRVLSKVTI